jgi:hypothetical protein
MNDRLAIGASLDGPLSLIRDGPAPRAARFDRSGDPFVSMQHQQGDRHGIQQRAGGAAYDGLDHDLKPILARGTASRFVLGVGPRCRILARLPGRGRRCQ